MVTIKLSNLCGRRFVDHGGGTCKTLSIKKNGGGFFVLVSRDDGRRVLLPLAAFFNGSLKEIY